MYLKAISAAGLLCSVAVTVPAGLAGQIVYSPPYVPTPMRLVDAMLAMGSLQAGDVLYDLGSGDGRIVVTAAQRGARAIGVEYDPALVERSWALADSVGVTPRVDFRRADLFTTDLTDASIVTLYLSHEFNLRLRPRLLEQLRPGSRIVSHGFHMGEWRPDTTTTIGEGVERATLYAWIVPAQVDGFWYLDIEGAVGVSLELRQRFQLLEGEIRRSSRALPVLAGEMRGDAIRFRIIDVADGSETPLEFEGRLEGERLTGTVRGPPGWGTRPWSAVRFSAPRLDPERTSGSAPSP